ncbi:MAG TPA: methyltransferase domain-containing protein [Polyangiales bacterium]|nr:methyltransferase domain-containing protein [Polyangiales bacterium]
MTTPSPFSVPEPWDLVAQGYADEAGAVMAPFSARAIELAKLAADAHVLDVAAGPGTLVLEVAQRVAAVTAVDFSAEMNERLQAQALQRGLSNVRVLQADGQALPLPAASFDAGFSMFGWMFFPDRAQGLVELHRVLRPRATLVVSSWAPLARSPLMAAMFGALQAADETFVIPGYNPDSLENPERLASELRAGGFEDVAVHDHTVELAFADTGALWTRMTRSSAPLVSLRKRLGETVWRERSELARGYLERELGRGAVSLSTTAWLGTGRRALIAGL